MDFDARFWLVAVSIIGAVVAISRWTGRVDTRLAKLESFMKSVTKDIKKILKLTQREVADASPLELTELGTNMAASMKAQDWAGSLAPGLLPEVVNKQPFEVDLFAKEDVETKLDDEMERRVSACAYEFGRKHTGVLNVLHVVLRLELLKRLRDQSPATS